MVRVNAPLFNLATGEFVNAKGAENSNGAPGDDVVPGDVASIRLVGLHTNARNHYDIESTAARGGKFSENLFEGYNQQAYQELYQYPGKYTQQWTAAAKEMGVSITGPERISQFFKLPDGAISDFETGDPKSIGEQIFRSIATPQEIADFENAMRPHLERMEKGMYRAVQKFTAEMIDAGPNAPSQRMDPLRIEELLESQGVDTSHLNFAEFVKTKDGSFQVEGDAPNNAQIEQGIKDSPELHGLLARLWDAHGSNGSALSDGSLQAGLKPRQLPDAFLARMLANQSLR